MNRTLVTKLLLGTAFVLAVVWTVQAAFALFGRGSVTPYLPPVVLLMLFAALLLGRLSRRQGRDG